MDLEYMTIYLFDWLVSGRLRYSVSACIFRCHRCLFICYKIVCSLCLHYTATRYSNGKRPSISTSRYIIWTIKYKHFSRHHRVSTQATENYIQSNHIFLIIIKYFLVLVFPSLSSISYISPISLLFVIILCSGSFHFRYRVRCVYELNYIRFSQYQTNKVWNMCETTVTDCRRRQPSSTKLTIEKTRRTPLNSTDYL